jgi:hypothetical protein
VTLTKLNFDPYYNDQTRWATSLAHSGELMIPCLDAVGARSVVEVGAYAGDLTRLLAEWAAQSGARISAVDPSPQPQLVQLANDRPEIELIRETSLGALPRIPMPDVAIIDGDHNYYTVSEELRLIGERAPGAELPLLLFHDVCWPHGRRDDYFAPDLIPEDYRQPLVGPDSGIFPGEEGRWPGGLPYPKSAAREGGPRNGVRTAVEDFVGDREDLRLVIVPTFFGFGVLWHREAPYSDELAQILDAWDRNTLLERLEGNRVLHLARSQVQATENWKLKERVARQEALLQRLLDSSAFAVAERLSRLRYRTGIATEASVVSKDEIRRALAD